MLMKKSNKILVGCLALLLVMAVGYALFSETITINGTATAKGEFKVSLSCEKGLNENFGTVEDIFGVSEGGYKNDSCIVNGNVVSYAAELEYPEASRFFTLKITNDGSMDVFYNEDTGAEVIQNKTCLDGGEDIYNYHPNGVFEDSECFDFGTESTFTMTTDRYLKFYILGYEKADGTIVEPNSEEEKDFILYDDVMEETTIKLQPGESFYAVMGTYFADLDLDGINSIYAKSISSHKFTFSQAKVN